jgi:hypothetical protein
MAVTLVDSDVARPMPLSASVMRTVFSCLGPVRVAVWLGQLKATGLNCLGSGVWAPVFGLRDRDSNPESCG